MKKPRIQSPLDLLPLHQKQALAAWLSTGGDRAIGMTYAAAVQQMRSEFGVKTSPAALSAFYHRQSCAAPSTAGIAAQPAGSGFPIGINISIAGKNRGSIGAINVVVNDAPSQSLSEFGVKTSTAAPGVSDIAVMPTSNDFTITINVRLLPS
jgi:hypothetical protein